MEARPCEEVHVGFELGVRMYDGGRPRLKKLDLSHGFELLA
jgi:hypothetical protein